MLVQNARTHAHTHHTVLVFFRFYEHVFVLIESFKRSVVGSESCADALAFRMRRNFETIVPSPRH